MADNQNTSSIQKGGSAGTKKQDELSEANDFVLADQATVKPETDGVGVLFGAEAEFENNDGEAEVGNSAADADGVDALDSAPEAAENTVVNQPKPSQDVDAQSSEGSGQTSLNVSNGEVSGGDARVEDVALNENQQAAGVNVIDAEGVENNDAAIEGGASGPTSQQSGPQASEFNNESEEANVELSLTVEDLPENATPGTLVATIDTTGSSDTGPFTFELTGPDAALFTIVGNEIFVAEGASIDFETLSTLNFSVTVSDVTGATATEDASVEILDVNEAPTEVTWTAFNLAEDAAAGTAVGSIAVADEDAGDSHSFELSGEGSENFSIVDGQVVVAEGVTLDHETNPTFNLSLKVTDEGGLETSRPITINVADVNEGPTDINLTANTVNENDAGAVVGTLSTTDVDDGQSHTYTVSDSRFEVVDGDLKLKDGVSLDHETEDSVTVTVTTDDGNGGTFNEDFTINVADVNEFAVTAVADNDSDANTISEAASNGDTVGITAFAEDLDATTSDVTYSLSDDADGAFTIDSDTGVVTVLDASKISFEDGDTRDIEVTATSADGSTSVQSYTINVTDTAESINVSGTFVDTGVAETQITGSDTADNITLHETGGNVRGGDGNDTLEGSVANDVLRGDEGNDTVVGGAGNDQIFGGAGADVLDGGEGIDTARYDADSIGINVNLETGEASGGEAEGDSFASIENVWGGSADDVITGSSGNNSLRGLDGDDVIDGGAGNDVLRGDEGNDTVVGGAGNDQIFGGAGADVLDGGEGVDTLRYEEDIEGVTLNLQTNTVSGGEAEGDTISNFENAYGGSADDVITGSSGNNTLRGRAGDDTIYGGDGNDSVFGDGGRDVLDGGDGIDTLRFDFDSAGVNVNLETGITSGGEAEGDTISNFENVFGGSGNDVLTGDDGRNVLRGNDGADTITGGAGNDILTGGAGDDAISGGSGTDTANFSGNWSDYTITENNGTYTIVDNRDGSPDGTDTVTDVENFQFADGTVGVADLVNSGPSDISLSANAVTENDTGAVVGTLTTTDGDVLDSHTYTVSDSRFEVVDGDLKLKDDQSLSFEDGDTVTVTVTTTDNAGASYNEDFNITVSDVTESINVSGTFVDTGVAETDITGSSGVDIITAHDDGSNIDGGDNYDTLIGGAGNDTFDGGLHNDTLSGSGGDDTLFGNHGADIITGGAGDDNIDGGTDTVGDDVAIYSGNWSDYTITEDSGTYTIVDNRDGSPDGTDTVTNIESFQFADGTVGVADLLNVGPTDISADSTSVDENATAGTVVANLSATDGDVLDNHTYEITGGASDLFEISGDQIVVKSGADLNFEGQTSHDVTVQVTDAHGASYSETVTINVNDQAEDIQLGDAGVTYTEVSVTETRVLGGDGDDTITGGDGDDTFGGGMGHDTLNGGDGDDALFGNWNNDTVDGGAGDDHIDGGADHDTLFGGEGNDTLEGGYSGNDIIEGGAGNDTIDGGGVGVGIVGGDNDTAVYSGNWSDYTITENNGTYTIVDNRDGSPDGTDTVTDVENFQFADGTVGVADLVNSGPSDISLSTNAVTENDTGAVVGTLTTTDGDALDSHTYTVSDSRFEVVDGDLKLKDDQSLSFEDGDTVTVTVTTTDSAGASYNEDFNITVSDVTESINVSGTFVDTGVAETDIAGSSGADVITAHDDGGKITGDDGDDTLIGGAGDDDLRGNNGEDDISGGAGNDILRGGDGDDIVSGGTGDDHIFGEAGADTLDGGDGVDTLRYNSDTDGLNVNLTDNTVTGAGSDGDTISNFENIQTGSGDDTLIGSSADNTLQSNDGDDTLEGRGGDDAIRGGDGNDTAVYSGNWSDYTITVNASDTYTVVDNRPGSPDGTDTVRDVENFQFADGIVPLADLLNTGPTDIDLSNSSVDENAAGAVVGELSTTDSNALDSHSYTVSDSRFEVVDGDLKLKDGVSLDHETEDTVSVMVTTTDSFGESFNEDFTINVADVNEGPTVTGESVSVELPQDVFYFTGNSNFGMLDPSTGEVTILGDTNGVSYGDVAVTADGTLFGTTFGSGELHRLDSATGDVLEVVTTDLPNNLNALVAAPDGTLYATDASSNQFFSIDADTGASTLVGNIGSSTSGGDLAFVDGELYLATGQSTIVRLDLDQIDGSNTIASEVIVPNSGGVTFFGLTSNGDGELYATDSDSNLYQVDIEGGTTTFISDLSSSISGSVYGAAAQSETSGFVEGNVLTNDSDVDGDALSITSFEFDGSSFTAGTEVPGEYGTFTLNSDGSYSYNVDENNAATLALGEGEQGTETFTYTVSDGNGGTAQATITVDVQGQNEGPTAISLSSTSVTESDAGAVVGTLSTTDVDASDTHTYTVSDSRFEVVDGDLKLKDDQNLDFETEQSVTVTVTTTDSTGASYNEDFTINVTDVAESINVSGTFLDTGVAETEISGSSGDDRIGANEDGGSVVYGLGGNDTLVGGAGNDDLRGGGGDDIINAGAGDDVVNVGNGDDVADGGDGTDTLLVGNADINIVNLDTGVYTKEFDNGDVDTNTISNFENVDLSSATGNNEVTGDSNDNVITGGSGNDTISGGDSNDTLLGGEGNDVLHGDAPAVSRIIDLEFEESSGTSAADSSGNSHTGTYVNGATAGGTTRDGGGNAAVLDGIDDYIEVAAHSDFAVDQGTISLWFNPDNLDDPQSALFSRDSSNFDGGGHITGWARSDGSVEIRIQSDTQSFHLRSDPNSIEAGEWNHVSFSFGPDGAKLYIDGTEAASNDTTIGITGNNEPWTVGASQTVSGDGTADNLREYFDGAIDDFSIVDRQLTAEEVVTVKDNGAAALEDTSGAGNDILDGGDGNDTLHGGAGNDTLYGGLGTDVAEFGGDVGDYSIDTSGGIITVADNNIADGDDGVDTLSGVETLRFNGTDYDISSFVTSGTASADVIIGSEGNDVPSGSFGDDIIFGGRGDDQVRGGEGADELHGGSGSDTLLYDTDTVGVTVNLATGAASGGDATGDTFTSFENVVGGLGNDDLTGDANDNTIWGRDGDDVIDGGAGNDRIYGEGGADAIDGGDGIDLVLYDHDTTGVTVNLETGTGSGGEAEGDTFDNIENVLGGHGDDTITGDSNNNVLWGRDGMDVINGGAGDDVLYGDGGNDTLSGGAGNDTLFGGDGDDILTSGTGADTIDGGDGSDTIQLHAVVGQGGVSNSIQDTGTDGTDTLEFVGGSGSSFDVQANFSAETSGIEIIDGTQATGEVLQANGLALDFDLTDVTLVGVDQIRGSGSDDTVIGSGGDDYITGGSGNDTLTGGLGDDLLEGGDGNDIFKIGLADGNDTIYGGSGGIYEDVIQLNGVTQEGLDNGSWTIALDNGTIESQADGQLDLSDDASGTITLQDGTSIDFYEIEQIQW